MENRNKPMEQKKARYTSISLMFKKLSLEKGGNEIVSCQ